MLSTRWILPLVLGLTGCLGAPAPSGQLDPRYGELRGCAPEEHADGLPPHVALVDTTALNPTLRALVAASESEPGFVELTLWYEPEGSNALREILSHSVSVVVADSVQKLVFASLLEAPEREDRWGLRLAIELGEPISYRVEPRVYCPPRPRDPDLENAIAQIPVTGTRYRYGTKERVVLLRVTVHSLGYVASGTVIRGADRGSTLERDLVDFVRQYSFEPATLDGIPVAGQIVVPVRIRA